MSLTNNVRYSFLYNIWHKNESVSLSVCLGGLASVLSTAELVMGE